MRLVIILAAIALSGCGGAPQSASTGEESLGYSYDGRTGLCFASTDSVTYLGYQVRAITNVPCTPGVMAVATNR